MDNSKEMINTIRKTYALPDTAIFRLDYSLFREWISDDKIKIDVDLRYEEGIYTNGIKTDTIQRDLTGWYIFDLTEEKITESHIGFTTKGFLAGK